MLYQQSGITVVMVRKACSWVVTMSSLVKPGNVNSCAERSSHGGESGFFGVSRSTYFYIKKKIFLNVFPYSFSFIYFHFFCNKYD